MSIPKISIVITCHGKALDLPIMLMCLEQQRANLEGKHSVTGAPTYYAMGEYCKHEREAIIVSDGAFEEVGLSSVRLGEIQKSYTFPLNIFWTEKEKQKNVGHHTREPGIKAANGDWIVLTNADNYFVTGWLDRLVTNITDDLGLIFWDCVHNGWKWSDKAGDGRFHGCQLKRGYIDLSCVAVRAPVAKKIGFPFRSYEGDYDYISACARECDNLKLGIGHIQETLLVHN